MKDFKGTPGPWTMNPMGSIFSHPDKCVVKRDDYFDWVATVQVSNMPQWEANGKAIAAVPDMIEALQAIIEAEDANTEAGKRAADRHNNTPGVGQSFDYMSYPEEPKWLKAAKAAISKALD